MSMKTTIEIDRPPSEVWPWLTEFDKKERWLKGLLSEKWYEGERGTAGSRFRAEIKEGPNVSEYDGEILAIEKPRMLRSAMVGGCGKEPMRMQVEYRLEEIPNGTRLGFDCRWEMKSGPVMKLFMPLFVWFGRMQTNRFHRDLKRLVESS